MCGFLNLNVNQGVITTKSFQNTINNWSGMVNLHVPEKWLFGEKFKCQSIHVKSLLGVTGLKGDSFLTLSLPTCLALTSKIVWR